MVLKTLTAEEVLAVHEVLTSDFAVAADPVSPPGVRSAHLLESAVSRQHTGSGNVLKYPTPYLNAAALTYGICLNHPFFNGNKRASLVALLCHLDRNDLAFQDQLTHDELYDFMVKVADHGFGKGSAAGKSQADAAVEEMAVWIRKRTRKIDRRERLCTFRELLSVLSKYGFEFDQHRDNHIDVVRHVTESRLFGLRKERVRQRVARIPYPGDGITVPRHVLTAVREKCGLTDLHGVDSAAFFAASRPTSYFVATYRGTLRRLART